MDLSEPVRWRVPAKVPVAKLTVGAIVVVAALLAGAEPWQLAVAAVAALGTAAWAARDLVAPVRLAADPAGVTVVSGFARSHRLGWSQIERVRVDVRRLPGAGAGRSPSRMLEIDTGETLYVLSRYDLDADLDDVAAHLEALRHASR